MIGFWWNDWPGSRLTKPCYELEEAGQFDASRVNPVPGSCLQARNFARVGFRLALRH